MACEALDALGRPDEVESWSYLDSGTPPVVPVEPLNFVWTEALGDGNRAGEWMGYFQRAIDDDGWRSVLEEWLPRLLPALAVGLYHGMIRSAHAVRAISVADSPARRGELVRALGYWSALFDPGPAPDPTEVRQADARLGVAHVARTAAHRYLAKPNIINLHGVTAPLALSLLIDHADDATAAMALGQVVADDRAMFADKPQPTDVEVDELDAAELVDSAIASGEAHAVKLVEASQRGMAATGDSVFLAAAERVTRRGRRMLAQVEKSEGS